MGICKSSGRDSAKRLPVKDVANHAVNDMPTIRNCKLYLYKYCKTIQINTTLIQNYSGNVFPIYMKYQLVNFYVLQIITLANLKKLLIHCLFTQMSEFSTGNRSVVAVFSVDGKREFLQNSEKSFYDIQQKYKKNKYNNLCLFVLENSSFSKN